MALLCVYSKMGMNLCAWPSRCDRWKWCCSNKELWRPCPDTKTTTKPEESVSGFISLW